MRNRVTSLSKYIEYSYCRLIQSLSSIKIVYTISSYYQIVSRGAQSPPDFIRISLCVDHIEKAHIDIKFFFLGERKKINMMIWSLSMIIWTSWILNFTNNRLTIICIVPATAVFSPTFVRIPSKRRSNSKLKTPISVPSYPYKPQRWEQEK